MSNETMSHGVTAVLFDDSLTQMGFYFAVIFSIAGILGNATTICALLKSASIRRQTTTTFIISLTVSDLIFCAFNLPLTASRYYHKEWRLGSTLCQLFPFFFYGNVASSLFSMVAITINRFILVRYPQRYSQIYCPSAIVAMIAGLWLFSYMMLAPTMAGAWGQFGLDRRTFSCTILSLNGASPKKFLMAFGVLLPCAVIVVCYALIYQTISNSRKTLRMHSRKDSGTELNSTARHENHRLTRTVAAIFGTFVICFFPLMLVNVFDNDEMRLPWAHVVASILSWLSAVINPVIYSVTNQQYRTAYRHLFACIRSDVCHQRLSFRPRPERNTSATKDTQVHYHHKEVEVNVESPSGTSLAEKTSLT